MNTVIIELNLPGDIYLALQAVGLSREELSAHAVKDLALQLYIEGRLSLGNAARLAGLRLLNFWALLVERGLPVFNYTDEDYETDLQVVQRFAAKRSV
jgi:predicted HTH domain antitoxin